MQPQFKKKITYTELSVLDEIVRARLFADLEYLNTGDSELKQSYSKVLRYITPGTDKRLKKLDKY